MGATGGLRRSPDSRGINSGKSATTKTDRDQEP